MNIGLDMMGGDFAPLEAVKGLQQYLSGNNGPAHLFCIGDEAQLKALLDEHQFNHPNIHTNIILHILVLYPLNKIR